MNTQTTNEIRRILEAVEMEADEIGRVEKWGTTVTQWQIRFTRAEKLRFVKYEQTFTVDYFTGLGITEPLEKESVLQSLFAEVTSITDFKHDTPEGFLSWCDEYGIAPNRESLDDFKTTHEIMEGLEKLFAGVDFNALFDYFNKMEG